MTKVCRIGVPHSLSHLNNEEIREILTLAMEQGGVESLKGQLMTSCFDKTIRLTDDLREFIKQQAEDTGNYQTVVSGYLIGIYHNQLKTSENERESLIRRLNELGYEVTIEERVSEHEENPDNRHTGQNMGRNQ